MSEIDTGLRKDRGAVVVDDAGVDQIARRIARKLHEVALVFNELAGAGGGSGGEAGGDG